MKKSILTLLILFVCAIQATTAYEYFTIYFSDGTKSEAFYATDVDSICYSKLNLDSIAYDEWQVQEIYTCDSVYRYPLAQIDSLSFKNVAIERVSKDIASVSATIVPIFAKCNSASEISPYLQEILQIDGVEDAWTDNQSLFVKIRDWGITTFSYPPILENTSNVYSLTRNISKTRKANGSKSPYKACIVNQVGKDELRDNSAIIKNLKQYFDEINIECDSINPLPLFYKTDIYDYDLIFLINHGDYDSQSHWISTGEEILCTGDVTKISEKDFATLEKLAYNLFKFEHPDYSPNMLSIGWVGEKREGVKVLVWYVKVSEHYIASSKRDFSGKNTAIFNVACQSLKGNYSLGNIFLNNKKAKCYLGYTESNNIGPKGGEWFLKNLMNGASAYVARIGIPVEWREQTFDDGTTPQLKLLPEMKKQTCEYRILNPETLASEELNDNNKSSVRVKGQILMLKNSNVVDKFSYGFLIADNPDMSQCEKDSVKGIYDSSTLYTTWEKTLDISVLKPNTTYYYRAYMNDGFSDCYGEIKSFTTKSDAEAYYVKDNINSIVTYYYDEMCESRFGQKIGKEHYVSYCDKVIFDSSFANYYPHKFCFTRTERDDEGNLCTWYNEIESIENLCYLNTDSITDMSGMFSGCNRLKEIDLSHFNTANVKNMEMMFENCNSLKNLDLSGFNTANVTNMYEMFLQCDSLTSIDLSSFNTTNVTNMGMMFASCKSLKSLNLNSFNTANVTNMSVMFAGCNQLTSLDLSTFNTSNVKDMEEMFGQCTSLTSLDFRNLILTDENGSGLFAGLKNLKSINLSNANTSKATDMSYMFEECSSLSSIDLSKFNTANVTNLNGMFFECNSLTSLDLSSFNTSNVTSMGNSGNGYRDGMFCECNSLTSLDLSSFDTSNVIYMGYMFEGCSSLTSLDLSSFDTSNVTHMEDMFSGCSSLRTIYAVDWLNSNSSSLMFSGCNNLVGGKGTKIGQNLYGHDKDGNPLYYYCGIDADAAHIDGGKDNPGLFTAK